VVQRIREGILAEVLKPGDHLGEIELAEKFYTRGMRNAKFYPPTPWFPPDQLRPRQRFVAVLGMKAMHKLVEIGAFQRFLFQSEVLIGAHVIDPELFGPRLFTGGLAVEE
jgi:hypothetical protein